MAGIHPTALIDPLAELDTTVSVGAYSVIGPHVRIGAGTTVGPHAVIEGRTTIGRDNRIFQFCSLGAVPQDKKYAGEPTELHIGNGNTMMAYSHLAHDAQVGSHTIFANNAQVAGHVQVGDWVILGAYTCVHQFVRIGAHAMTGMGTTLLQDVPPFAMVSGNPCEARGFNLEGLKRRGFSPARVSAVKQMHKLIYRSGLTLDEARQAVQGLAAETPEAAADVQAMAAFLSVVGRGLVR
jgi:UDP-N-acetylglucosamine acyltransferase